MGTRKEIAAAGERLPGGGAGILLRMCLLRMPESGMHCSLIGSRLPKFSIHQAADDLKEKEVPGGLQFESSLVSAKSCIG
jgi:hypothetical protein